jgi:hypothetical protein
MKKRTIGFIIAGLIIIAGIILDKNCGGDGEHASGLNGSKVRPAPVVSFTEPGDTRVYFCQAFEQTQDREIYRVDWSPPTDTCFYPLTYHTVKGDKPAVMTFSISNPSGSFMLWRSHPWQPPDSVCMEAVR